MEYSPEVLQSYTQRPRTFIFKMAIFIGLILLFIWSIPSTDGPLVSQSGVEIVQRMFQGLINPSWDKIFSLENYHVPYLMFETVMVAFLGTMIGTLAAIPLGFLGSRNITNSVVAFLVSVLVVLIRTMPFFVIGLIYIRAVGPGVFAGVLTIGFTSTGMISKLYTESVEDMDKGILEALDSTGATALQKVRVGIIPQLFANFVSHSAYRFDINVRNAIILGLISAGRLGFELQAAIGNFRYRDAGAFLWGIIIVVMVIESASAKLRRKLIYG